MQEEVPDPVSSQTRTLYFDESGFTGYNLLDAAQPIFAIASTDIGSDDAETILRECFPRYRGDEFKLTNIWRSSNKIGLVEFGRRVAGLQESVFTWIIDKRFAVLTKMVDFLIEPCVTDAGFDFYADGFCWKYANYIHFGLVEFATPELYTSLVENYQTFSRDPSSERLNNLQTQLALMAASSDEPVRIFFEQMALGASLFTRYQNLSTFKSSNELQVTSMIAIVSHWRKCYPEDFNVVHDASSNFFGRRDLWEKITNSSVPKQTHPLGDGTLVEFPLRIVSTGSIDSKNSYSIQFCDILAGLASRYFNKKNIREDQDLLDVIVDAGLGSSNSNGIRPSPVFPDFVPPRRLIGPDVVDRMTGIIFGPHNDRE